MRLINIQFMRAIAALAVMLYHTADHYAAAGGRLNTYNFYSVFQQCGYVGVDIFFVLSGYVIATSTRKLSGYRDCLTFLYKRTARIYLGYWPLLIVVLLTSYFSANKARLLNGDIDFIGSVLLTAFPTNKLLLPVAWSLTYEVYFYGTFAVLLLLQRQWLPYFIAMAASLILAIQTFAIIDLNIYHVEQFAHAPKLYMFYLSPYNLEFLGGCMVGLYSEHRRIPNVSLLLIASLGLFIIAMWYQNTVAHASLNIRDIPQRVFFYGSMAVMLFLALVELERRGVILAPKFATTMGAASYSLYLTHTIIQDWSANLRPLLSKSWLHRELGLITLVVVMIGYSLIHYRYVEKPLLNFALRLGHRYRIL